MQNKSARALVAVSQTAQDNTGVMVVVCDPLTRGLLLPDIYNTASPTQQTPHLYAKCQLRGWLYNGTEYGLAMVEPAGNGRCQTPISPSAAQITHIYYPVYQTGTWPIIQYELRKSYKTHKSLDYLYIRLQGVIC